MKAENDGAAAGPMAVTLVVAASRNGVIGRAGTMPWRMPSSLRRFRALTMGRPMIMGRKTYDSIGRPLDGRDTIIVTRSVALKVEGAYVVGTLEAALALAARLAIARGVAEIVVAGGGEIYRAALAYATSVELDLIDAEIEGDTRMPDLLPTDWEEAGRAAVTPLPADQFAMSAIRYRRIGAPSPLPRA